MMHYSIDTRDQTFVKCCRFLSFAKNMNKILVNISKNLSSKCRQKLLYHAKQSATVALKTASKRAIHKKAAATGDLTGNEIANKNTKSEECYHRIVQRQSKKKQKI